MGFEGGFGAQVFDRAQTCVEPREYHTWLLAHLRNAAGCDGALIRPGPRWAGAQTLYLDQSSRFTDLYVERAARYGPDLRRWCELSRGQEAFVDGEIYDTRAQDKMAIYREVIRREGIRSILACPLSFRGEVLGLAFLFRMGAARPFVAQDAKALTRALPLLALAEKALRATFGPIARRAPLSQREERFWSAFQSLGHREQQVARLIGEGLQSKEIAQQLGTSPHTVRAQTQRIFGKLGVHSRTQVALLLRGSGANGSPD